MAVDWFDVWYTTFILYCVSTVMGLLYLYPSTSAFETFVIAPILGFSTMVLAVLILLGIIWIGDWRDKRRWERLSNE